jgi:2'-phosphotransferase
MTRQHIHFQSSNNAISGIRHNSSVLIHIDMKLAMDNGIKFYMSKNGVILSSGNDNGIINAKYIETITDNYSYIMR